MKKWLFGIMLFSMVSLVSAMPIYNGIMDTGDETFYLDDLGGAATNSLFEIKLENAGWANQNAFGIYQINAGEGVGTLGVSLNYLELFTGVDDVGYAAKLSWDTNTDTVSLQKSSDGIFYNSVATTAGLTVNHNDFGFYLDTPDGLWFSQTALNLDGVDHMVSFEAGAVDSWILAWEDVAYGGDRDYNDFVLLADDILPVQDVPPPPTVAEPGSLALMGLGLIGTVFGIRRNNKALIAKRK